MTIKIKRLSKNDIGQFIETILLFERVFEMKGFILPDKKHLENLLQQNSFYVFIATLDGKVVGGVTAYSMTQYYSKQNAIYLYDLAVDTNMQRQGIGKQLIAALNNYCKAIGAEVVFLEADEPDKYAHEFYRSTGAVEEKGYFYSYPLKNNLPNE